MSRKPTFTSKTINRIISAAQEWLGDYRSYSSPLIEYKTNGARYRFYLSINKVGNNNIYIQEIILGNDNISHIYRNWTFIKDIEWNVLSLEKDGKHIVLADLSSEIFALDAVFDEIYKKTNWLNIYYEDEVLSVDSGEGGAILKNSGPLKRLLSTLYSEVVLHPSVFVPIFTLSIIIMSFFIIGYFVKINKIQNDLGSNMDDYLMMIKNQIQDLDTFKNDAEGKLELLGENFEQSKADFEFNRQNAYVNVIRLAEELTRYLPARKEAYKLIASNIKEAVSYGEIIYEMSNLPSEEYQARIFLATEEQHILPLSRLKPSFSSMAYPVAIDGRDNDGRGFRITSGYTDKRKDPFRDGVYAHHFAVDIINVANIDYISYAGNIIREGMPPGNVVCIFDGIVKILEFDEAYGNTIEIKHSLTKEIKEKYATANYWTTFYAHLEELPKKKINDWVSKEEKIGVIGSSGRSTGPHLHFEVRIYCSEGMYRTKDGERFNKINPYPSEKEKD